MASLNRKLNKVEETVLVWSINTMAFFESCYFTEEHLKDALKLTIQKYPYMRTRIEKDIDDGYSFIENNSKEIDDLTSIIWNNITSEDEFNNWQERFNLFGSNKFIKRVFNLELDSYLNQKYHLYFSINHGGSKIKEIIFLKLCFS